MNRPTVTPRAVHRLRGLPTGFVRLWVAGCRVPGDDMDRYRYLSVTAPSLAVETSFAYFASTPCV